MATTKTYFPEEFIAKYRELLGDEWQEFFETIKRKQPKAFWANTNLVKVEDVSKSLKAKDVTITQLPFHKQAFSISMARPADLSEFKEGKIALQEKAAMLPAIALAPSWGDKVLDACAAPGMKTIQLSNLLGRAGKALALDVNTARFKSLAHNKGKYSLGNVEIGRADVRNVREKFPKILLDAPCSSEGLVRKKRDALKGWSQKLVERKAQLQKELISHCFSLLEEGGEMLYSTCSFAPEENEEIVNLLLKERPEAEVLPVKFEGIKIRKNDLCRNAARLYPQDNDTQQFFLAKILKAK